MSKKNLKLKIKEAPEKMEEMSAMGTGAAHVAPAKNVDEEATLSEGGI